MLATRAEDSKIFSGKNMLASSAEPPGSGQYGEGILLWSSVTQDRKGFSSMVTRSSI